jgi:hypothetical protein
MVATRARLATVRIGGPGTAATVLPAFEGSDLSAQALREAQGAFAQRLRHALAAAGYPMAADPARVNPGMVVLCLLTLMVYATAVTGPMAAWLVEMFPPQVRYTSMSVAYHIGAGWFGGFLPAIAFALVAVTGNIYSGLWYPVIVAAVTVGAGLWLLPETSGPGQPEVTGRATRFLQVPR